MLEKIRHLVNDYGEIYSKAWSTNNFKDPIRSFITNDLKNEFKKLPLLNDDRYIVKASCGVGLFTTVPWIAVFDNRITTDAKHGEYIVYLLNKDTKELYLAFIQAIDGMNVKKLKENSLKIRKILNTNEEIIDVDTGNDAYDAGCIIAKKYTIDDLYDEKSFLEDLAYFIKKYDEYYKKITNKEIIEEYLSDTKEILGTFYSWDIISKTQAVKHCDKSFFDYNGSGIPKEICWFFEIENSKAGEKKNIILNYNGKKYDAYLINDTTDRVRTQISWYADLGNEFSNYKDIEGITLTFNKEGPDEYSVCFNTEGETKVQITTKEVINRIKEYIAGKGFTYSDKLIENFYLCLKSKPFVILAGTSGTGKTRLVKLFAEAIGAEYKLVSVRPDWSDGSDLFGHYDLNGRFIEGPVCKCFEYAENNPEKPVFLCLDEMNLARVEYYLSDFLSVIESREKNDDGKIFTKEIAQYKNGIPDNLYVIGTVNMDETTFPFSKKVLDRANTIEFSFVNLMPDFEQSQVVNENEKIDVENDFLRTKYLVLTKDCLDEKDFVVKICEKLEELNKILSTANAHIGYRVRDEIVFYMLNNKKAENLMTDDEAFDYEIMQKILPRIQGSSSSIKDMLIELFKFCRNNASGIDEDVKEIGKQMKNEASGAVYPVSAEKISYMMTRYEEDGFTSYWL